MRKLVCEALVIGSLGLASAACQSTQPRPSPGSDASDLAFDQRLDALAAAASLTLSAGDLDANGSRRNARHGGSHRP